MDGYRSHPVQWGDPNLYGYVQNDPVNWRDPWGLLEQSQRQTIINSWTAQGAAIGALLGYIGGGGAGLTTGPGAPAAVPAGAALGATGGAVVGAAAGATLGSLVANMMGEGDGGSNFEKMKQGDNTSKKKEFNDAFNKIKKDLGKNLTREQQRQLHDYITKQGYDGFWDIYDAGMDLLDLLQKSG